MSHSQSKKIPLVKPFLPTLEEVSAEISHVLSSGQLTNFGPFSRELDSTVCEYLGVRYALCLSNASTGLMLLLNILPKGTEVIVPSFTFLPTVMALLWNDLIPVFADIDTTYTLCPERVKECITSRTSAIVGVHVFGNPCHVEALSDLAAERNLKLFFDSAHAFGATVHDKHIGTFGDAEVFSFSATKLLSCGEGGAICTNDESLYREILDRRNYGFAWKSYNCRNMGTNAKISEFSAILGLWGLRLTPEGRRIDIQVEARNKIAEQYRARLAGIPGLGYQDVLADNKSTYKDFTLVVESEVFGCDRDEVKKTLNNRGIESASYFSPPIHKMRLFSNYDVTGNLVVTDHVERRILSLPIYHGLSDSQMDFIIETLLSAGSRSEAGRPGGTSQRDHRGGDRK